MIENVSTQLTMFHCLCPLPASRKGLRLPLRSALFGEGGRDWRPCLCACNFVFDTRETIYHHSRISNNVRLPNICTILGCRCLYATGNLLRSSVGCRIYRIHANHISISELDRTHGPCLKRRKRVRNQY